MSTMLRCTMLAAAALIAGCAHWQETGGEVSVSRPQVFTRERLLNERLGEVNWLRDQLDRPFTQGLQGFRDVREAAAFVLNLQAEFDVAKRRVNAAKIGDGEAQRERERRSADLRQQIEETQLQQQLDALKKKTDTAPPDGPVPDALKQDLVKLSGQIGDLAAKVDALERKLTPASAVKGSAGALLDATAARYVNPNQVETSRASLSSRDRLEDEAAFRDHVNARIREAILDDTHDLKGFALYEFKFDATIVPGVNTRRSAVAELEIARDDFVWTAGSIASVGERLRQRIEEDANALIQRQQERAALLRLDRVWAHRIVNHFNAVRGDVSCRSSKTPDQKPTGEEVRKFVFPVRTQNDGVARRSVLTSGSASEWSGSDVPAWTYCLIADYVRYRLHLALGDAFQIVPNIEQQQAPGRRPLVSVKVASAVKLLKDLERLSFDAVPWVATVSPKEYAQNISDVATNQQVRQITVGLGLSDGLGTGGRIDAEKYRQEQEIVHAIKRQPLAASFVRGQNRFGWILGPKYAISDNKAVFMHTTARYAFTASIAVPGWFSSICLTGRGYWIEDDGRRSAPFALFAEGAPDGPNRRCKGDEALVRLPNTYRALFFALLDANFDLFSDPEIFVQRDADDATGVTTLRATAPLCALPDRSDKSCEQSIVIEGRDLWRNPAVFVGEQRADRVDVLPSMRGIVATWKSLRQPAPGPGGRVARQDLFVSTSTGQDRLEGVVTIAAEDLAAPKPFARLRAGWLEKSAGAMTVDFEFPPAAFPRSFAAMALRVQPAGSSAPAKLVESDPERGVGRLQYRLADPAALGFGDRSGDFLVDLLFKVVPGDDWVSLSDPQSRRVLYIANASERELVRAGAASVDFSAGRSFGAKELAKLQQALRFALPADEALFFRAYPGLAQALVGQGGEARIRLQFDDDTAPVELVAERTRTANGKSQLGPRISALSAQQAELLPEDERQIRHTVSVFYRHGGSGWQPVVLSSAAELSITGLKKPAPPAAPKEEKK